MNKSKITAKLRSQVYILPEMNYFPPDLRDTVTIWRGKGWGKVDGRRVV